MKINININIEHINRDLNALRLNNTPINSINLTQNNEYINISNNDGSYRSINVKNVKIDLNILNYYIILKYLYLNSLCKFMFFQFIIPLTLITVIFLISINIIDNYTVKIIFFSLALIVAIIELIIKSFENFYPNKNGKTNEEFFETFRSKYKENILENGLTKQIEKITDFINGNNYRAKSYGGRLIHWILYMIGSYTLPPLYHECQTEEYRLIVG